MTVQAKTELVDISIVLERYSELLFQKWRLPFFSSDVSTVSGLQVKCNNNPITVFY